MPVRLMPRGERPTRDSAPNADGEGGTRSTGARLRPRAFFKLVGASVGLGVASQLIVPPKAADADSVSQNPLYGASGGVFTLQSQNAASPPSNHAFDFSLGSQSGGLQPGLIDIRTNGNLDMNSHGIINLSTLPGAVMTGSLDLNGHNLNNVLMISGVGGQALEITSNVGIGTTPAYPLDVSATGTTIARFLAFTTANSSVIIGNSTASMNLGVGSTTTDPYIWSEDGNFFIGSDGSPSLYVKGMANGNVGIGTPNPGDALDINRAGGTKTDIHLLQAGSAEAGIGFNPNDSNLYLTNESGLGTGGLGTSSRSITLSSTGNVGIGMTMPGCPLQVGASQDDIIQMVRIGQPTWGFGVSSMSPAGYFFIADYTNSLRAFFVDQYANVGIGTTPYGNGSGTTWSSLNVAGISNLSSTVFCNGSVIVDQGGTNGGTLNPGAGMIFGSSGSGEGIASKRTNGGNQNGLDFYATFAPRMSIAGSSNGNPGTQVGYIGIATTNPIAQLDVAGGLIHTGGTASPSISLQGAYLGWNALNGGTGETDLINARGGGGGGFAFFDVGSSWPSPAPIPLLQVSGVVNGGQLKLNGTLIADLGGCYYA